MTAIAFDTLKFVRTLRDADFEERQAEAISQAFRNAQKDLDVAKKTDLRELDSRLTGQSNATDARLDAIRNEMNANFTSIRNEMNANFTSIRWFLLIIAMIGVSPYVKMLLD